MLSKKESEQIIENIIKRDIGIGSILYKKCKNEVEYILILGMVVFGKGELAVLKFYKELPKIEVIMRALLEESFKRVPVSELGDYKVYTKIEEICSSKLTIAMRQEFIDTIQEAKVIPKVRVGTFLTHKGVQHELVIGVNPLQVILLKGCSNNTQESSLIQKLIHDDIHVKTIDENVWRYIRHGLIYIKSFNETEIKKVVIKLRLMGKI